MLPSVSIDNHMRERGGVLSILLEKQPRDVPLGFISTPGVISVDSWVSLQGVQFHSISYHNLHVQMGSDEDRRNTFELLL